MSVIFQDHVDGTNGVGLTTSNTTFGAFGLSSGTATFDTSVHAAGVSSAACTQTASFGTAALITPYLGTTLTNDWTRFCFQMSVLPSGGNMYIAHKANGAGAFVTRLAVNPAGKLLVYNGTTLTSTSTTTLAASTMYRIEWHVNGTASTVLLYASPSASTPLETINTTIAAAPWNHTNLGIASSGNSNLMTVWVDEVVIDSVNNPGPLGGVPGASTGSLAFAGSTTSPNSAGASGTEVFGGTAQPTTAGGSISGFADTFATASTDTSKWNVLNGLAVPQSNAAIVGATSPLSGLSSAQVWDGTASQFYVAFSPPASGSGDTMVSLVDSLDATKYAQMKVSAGVLSMTFVNGGADAGLVTRPITANDNMVRFTESAGNVLVEVKPRGGSTWSTLRSFVTPAWWNTLRVQLTSFSSTPTGTLSVFSDMNNTPSVPVGRPNSSTLTDAFTGTALDTTKWSVAGPGVLKVAASQVEIDASLAGATTVTSLATYTLDTVSLQVTPAHNSANDVTTLKVMSPVAGTEARLECVNGLVKAEFVIGGVSDGYEVTAVHDNTKPLYLQLSVDQVNQVLVWAFSPDGVNFNVLRTQGIPGWYLSVQIAFGSTAH